MVLQDHLALMHICGGDFAHPSRELQTICVVHSQLWHVVYVPHPDGPFAFVAGRLITLDKNSWSKIDWNWGSTSRIIAKAILKVVANDVQSAASPLQTCAGHEAGVEAAMYATKMIYFNECNEGLLLVDITIFNRHAQPFGVYFKTRIRLPFLYL